jgi:hypothetical protein
MVLKVHGGRRACFFADCTVFSPTKTFPQYRSPMVGHEVNGWTMSPHGSKGLYRLMGKQNGYSEAGRQLLNNVRLSSNSFEEPGILL